MLAGGSWRLLANHSNIKCLQLFESETVKEAWKEMEVSWADRAFASTVTVQCLSFLREFHVSLPSTADVRFWIGQKSSTIKTASWSWENKWQFCCAYITRSQDRTLNSIVISRDQTLCSCDPHLIVPCFRVYPCQLKGALCKNVLITCVSAICEQTVTWREKVDLPSLCRLPTSLWLIYLSCLILLDCGFLF